MKLHQSEMSLLSKKQKEIIFEKKVFNIQDITRALICRTVVLLVQGDHLCTATTSVQRPHVYEGPQWRSYIYQQWFANTNSNI
jgi:hypothetical protein